MALVTAWRRDSCPFGTQKDSARENAAPWLQQKGKNKHGTDVCNHIILNHSRQDAHVHISQNLFRNWHNCTLLWRKLLSLNLRIEYTYISSGSIPDTEPICVHKTRKLQAPDSFKWPNSEVLIKKPFLHGIQVYHLPSYYRVLHYDIVLHRSLTTFEILKFRPLPSYGRCSLHHCIGQQNLTEQQARSWLQPESCHAWLQFHKNPCRNSSHHIT